MKNILLGLGKIIVFLIILIILIKALISNNFSFLELTWKIYVFIAFLCALLVILVKPGMEINFLDLFKINERFTNQEKKINELENIIKTKSEAKSEAKSELKIEHHTYNYFNISDTASTGTPMSVEKK